MFGIKTRENETLTQNNLLPKDKTNGNSQLVDLRQVVKIYENAAGKFPALKGVDLKVKEAEFVSIIGKSGSGKSTLINMMTGIDRPSTGEIIIDKTEVHRLNEEEMALWRGKSIGVIFQFFQLLPTLTAVENVMLPMDYSKRYPVKERPERALYLLDLVGLADDAHKLPSELSGGQRQSIAIARAMANDPPILTADEPTGNLDSRSADMVLRLFEDLVDHGKTILMVTHDMDLANRALRIVKLADGEIVDEKINH